MIQLPYFAFISTTSAFIILSIGLQNKVSGVTFKYGCSVDELQILDAQEVESRFAGWIHTNLPR